MDGFKRKADGQRIFSVEFKRQVVGQIHSGEKPRPLAVLFQRLLYFAM